MINDTEKGPGSENIADEVEVAKDEAEKEVDDSGPFLYDDGERQMELPVKDPRVLPEKL